MYKQELGNYSHKGAFIFVSEEFMLVHTIANLSRCFLLIGGGDPIKRNSCKYPFVCAWLHVCLSLVQPINPYEKLLSWNMRKKSVADDTTFSHSVDLWVNHARLRRGWSSPLWSMGVIVLCDSEEWLFNPESNGILVVDSCIDMFYLLGISQSACNFNRNV